MFKRLAGVFSLLVLVLALTGADARLLSRQFYDVDGDGVPDAVSETSVATSGEDVKTSGSVLQGLSSPVSLLQWIFGEMMAKEE